MKKVLYFAALLFAITLTSCEKEDMGGTATESLAGQWYVQGNVVEDGQVVGIITQTDILRLIQKLES